MTDKLTVRIELHRGLLDIVDSTKHKYETEKAAREDFELLSKMLKKFTETPE